MYTSCFEHGGKNYLAIFNMKAFAGKAFGDCWLLAVDNWCLKGQCLSIVNASYFTINGIAIFPWPYFQSLNVKWNFEYSIFSLHFTRETKMSGGILCSTVSVNGYLWGVSCVQHFPLMVICQGVFCIQQSLLMVILSYLLQTNFLNYNNYPLVQFISGLF